MAVHCPVCGKMSQDVEFCDHCNADLVLPTSHMGMPNCPVTPEGLPLSEDQWNRLTSPQNSLVIPMDGETWRVRWVPADGLQSLGPAFEKRHRLRLKCLPEAKIKESGAGTWVLTRPGERYAPWEKEIADPIESLRAMITHARELAAVLDELHRHDLIWANFDPQCLERDSTGQLRITNLDLRVFSRHSTLETVRLAPAFAAPEILGVRRKGLGPRTDVFHLAAMLYYWQARLLPGGFPTQGLESFEYQFPPLRVYHPHLPEGVEHVLRRGLAFESLHRYEHPRKLCERLTDVLHRCEQRRQFTGELTWEIGKHTRAGRLKTELKKGNEDKVFEKTFTEPARALVAVADGISTCNVGSGALASLIATIVMENHFEVAPKAEEFEEVTRKMARGAAQMLLDWALEKGFKKQLLQGGDLMGTTLTLGWIEGREVRVANLGDSRAYLIHGSHVEQLTVDGDLGTQLLQEGRPPEEVRELGYIAKALRQCVGGCRRTDDGGVAIFEDACEPTYSRWPLIPGDVSVFCTDGLVEEDVFLSPEKLMTLAKEHADLSAQGMAEKFSDAADSIQRLPSSFEPDGFGDNISCVVVRIRAAEPASDASDKN